MGHAVIKYFPPPIFMPPLGLPPLGVGPAPLVAHSQATTELHIRTSTPRRLPHSVGQMLSVSLNDFTGMMWEDAGRGGLAADTCESFCNDLIIDRSGQLYANYRAYHLPTHFRRMASEVLGTAAALAVANNLSPSFTPLRADFNEAAKPHYHWRHIWPGDGPDYLVCSPLISSLFFLEAKGEWGLEDGKPRQFPEFKTQSLNACLIHIPSGSTVPVSRHVLSYCGIVPGLPLTVRWFNQRIDGMDEGYDQVLALISGFAQFLHDLRTAGLTDLAYTYSSGLDLRPERDLKSLGFIERGNIWFRRFGAVSIAIEQRALNVFEQFSSWRRDSEGLDLAVRRDEDEGDDPRRLIEALHRRLIGSLMNRPDPVDNARLMFRLPTGISFWRDDVLWKSRSTLWTNPDEWTDG